jgi:ketosteroid isomerase-like protein
VRAAFLLLVPALLGAQQRDSVELVRLESVWNDAHVRGDTLALKKLRSDDIIVVVTEMPLFSKSQLLAFWRSGRSNITRYETSELHVRRYGDAAVVEGRMRRTRDFNGRVVDDDWRFTKAYVKRSGRWQVASYHASPVPASRNAATSAPVAIVGTDYAFIQPPTTLPPGDAVFTFENRGKVRHELSLALLRPGVAVDDAVRAPIQGERRRDHKENNIGELHAAPPDTAAARLIAKLIPGRSYALICSLRDAPDAQPHILMGMVAGFSVPDR